MLKAMCDVSFAGYFHGCLAQDAKSDSFENFGRTSMNKTHLYLGALFALLLVLIISFQRLGSSGTLSETAAAKLLRTK
jgi:hypothetical protein